MDEGTSRLPHSSWRIFYHPPWTPPWPLRCSHTILSRVPSTRPLIIWRWRSLHPPAPLLLCPAIRPFCGLRAMMPFTFQGEHQRSRIQRTSCENSWGEGKGKGNNSLGKRLSQESLEKGLNASLHDFVRIGGREGRMKANIDTDIHTYTLPYDYVALPSNKTKQKHRKPNPPLLFHVKVNVRRGSGFYF